MREKKAKKILAEVKNTYNDIAAEFDQTRRYAGKEFWLFKEYIKPGSFIVDLGCGNGRFLKFLEELSKDWTKPAFHYLGIDNNDKLLAKAREQFPHFNEENFINGDQLSIPIAENCVDTMFNIRAFHHIPSWQLRLQAVLEMKRVLKPDGILIITVWNLWQKKYWKEILKGFFRSILTLGSYSPKDLFIPWAKKAKRYYHAFTSAELSSLISHSGLEVMKMDSQGHDLIIIAKKKHIR